MRTIGILFTDSNRSVQYASRWSKSSSGIPDSNTLKLNPHIPTALNASWSLLL